MNRPYSRTYNGFSGVDIVVGETELQAIEFTRDKAAVVGQILLSRKKDLKQLPRVFTVKIHGYNAAIQQKYRMEIRGCRLTTFDKKNGTWQFLGDHLIRWRRSPWRKCDPARL